MERNLSEESSPVHLRLIPLTSEIKLAMMEFSSSNMDSVDKNSKSLNDMVREEVEQSLQNLESSIENCVKKEELSEIINRCIQDNLALCPSAQFNNETTTPSPNQVTIEFEENKSSGEDLVLKENFQLLEKRINFLESRLTALFQLIPRLKKVSTNFKIDRETLQRSIEKCQLSSDETSGDNCENTLKSSTKNTKNVDVNPYDEMYYEWRQNKMNLLHYKHSEYSLQLNSKLEMESSHGIIPNNSLPSAFSKPHVKAKFIDSQHLLI
ncbi:uncharacterized protein LOC129915909 [Episyrphus balteatus]|uniref:uncharacterized protein LOC129915909 n=1 Tax=Episyrphus balteatus TaxID=286459 RepID=UPI00248553F3|nr:uncharacterized protein LOC129915909 [Episyrphus balteatus]